ncbi:MAG: pyruvate dehydrogenase (acetyl-transferring), homodimeric type, partial [Verrucomicrobiales bacterium]
MKLKTREQNRASKESRESKESSVSGNGNGSHTRSAQEGNGVSTDKYFESIEHIMEYVLKGQNPERARFLLDNLFESLRSRGVEVPKMVSTPYLNTITAEEQPEYPGDLELERKIKSYIRWNAMAMVVNANRKHDGLGGHISSFASSATLYEVGYNHFFRGGDDGGQADLVYFQGHATPGNYARAFLEGR